MISPYIIISYKTLAELAKSHRSNVEPTALNNKYAMKYQVIRIPSSILLIIVGNK